MSHSISSRGPVAGTIPVRCVAAYVWNVKEELIATLSHASHPQGGG